jgi:hypothetical protein
VAVSGCFEALSAANRKTASGSTLPGSDALTDSGSERLVRRYDPGPQTASDSAKNSENARHVPGLSVRLAAVIALALPRVLSTTGAAGNPVDVCDPDCDCV